MPEKEWLVECKIHTHFGNQSFRFFSTQSGEKRFHKALYVYRRQIKYARTLINAIAPITMPTMGHAPSKEESGGILRPHSKPEKSYWRKHS